MVWHKIGFVDSVKYLTGAPRKYGVPKVPTTLEKVSMKLERSAGRTRGNVIFHNIRALEAPNISPDSSSLESILDKAAETRRKVKGK